MGSYRCRSQFALTSETNTAERFIYTLTSQSLSSIWLFVINICYKYDTYSLITYIIYLTILNTYILEIKFKQFCDIKAIGILPRMQGEFGSMWLGLIRNKFDVINCYARYGLFS